MIAVRIGIAGLAPACDVPFEAASSGPVAVGSEPAQGQRDVDRAASLRVFFDRRILPREAERAQVRLVSGERSSFLFVWVDPLEAALVVRPSVALDPDVQWRLQVEGLRDLDGVEMAEPWEVAFQTGAGAVGDPVPPPLSFADVAPVLASCTGESCHGGPSPALGLDLSSAAAVGRTAVGVPARLSQSGGPGRLGLEGLPRVDVVAGVGRPATSFLLYKVLGDPHVTGDPMPPPPAAPLSPAALATLAAWIAAGAPTD
ncbi:MAG: Ig-like domain-containing protein [Sandaracinaceae bacterium]|nr:Ig-like domain-containing protein [Sandaracinaceae bacterium]